MKNLFFIASFLLTLGYSAQDKKIDKLEMLYDQGHYKIVLRKCDRLIGKDGYANNASIKVFTALSEYQLSKNNDKFSSSSAVYDYEKFLELDSNFYYQKIYANYIYDLQLGITDEIRALNEKGEVEKAKVKYDTYNRLFENIAQFDELVATEVEVEPTPSINGESDNHIDGESNGLVRSKIIEEAKKHIGTPYKYGGVSPKGFDCSGFTHYVFSKNGKGIPRTASSQSQKYEKIKLSKVKPGDLVFFGGNKNNISHVGIVVSEDDNPLKMIHASSSRGIMISNVTADPYWKPKLQFAVRIIE